MTSLDTEPSIVPVGSRKVTDDAVRWVITFSTIHTISYIRNEFGDNASKFWYFLQVTLLQDPLNVVV